LQFLLAQERRYHAAVSHALAPGGIHANLRFSPLEVFRERSLRFVRSVEQLAEHKSVVRQHV